MADFLANWHTVLSLSKPKGIISNKSLLIKFICFQYQTSFNSFQFIINFSLVFKITPKVGVCPIPFQLSYSFWSATFFRAKCVTSYATFLMAVFERGVDDHFGSTKELVAIVPMKGTT